MHEKLYVHIARWCNQPHLFKKMSFREFCLAHLAYTREGHTPAALVALNEFVDAYPEIAAKYVDLKYMNFRR